MKSWIFVPVILVVLPSAGAQTPQTRRAEGYVFVGPFTRTSWDDSATYVAAGGDIFLYKGVTIGAEVGPVLTRSEVGTSYVFGLGSANVGYRFRRQSEEKVEPFITAGYSTTFRAGMQHGSNVGAGINLWLKKNVAVRFEVHQYLGRLRILEDARPRFGITFRYPPP